MTECNHEFLSTCCGAPALSEICDNIAFCKGCRDHAEFECHCDKCLGIESKRNALNIDSESLSTNESYNLNVVTNVVDAKNRK